MMNVKKSVRFYSVLLLLVLFFGSSKVNAQNDSIQVKISEEEVQHLGDPNLVMVPAVKKRIAIFDQKQLLKLSFSENLLFPTKSYDEYNRKAFVTLSYERKIDSSPFSFSVDLNLMGNSLNIRPDTYITEEEISPNVYRTEYNEVNAHLNIAFRYYYSQKGNIERNGAGNNLNGPYVSLGIWNVLNQISQSTMDYEYNHYGRRVLRRTEQESFSVRPTLIYLNWGYQQRFFKRFYAEAHLGPGVFSDENSTDVWFLGNLNLGIALWSN